MMAEMENFWLGVCIYLASVLTMFFGALTLGAILSWLWVGEGSSNARLLLFAAPPFVIFGIFTWALWRMLLCRISISNSSDS